jgi:hypothetical protein
VDAAIDKATTRAEALLLYNQQFSIEKTNKTGSF